MAGRAEFLTAPSFVVMDSRQVNRGALATLDRLDGTIVVLNAANSHFDTARFDKQLVANGSVPAADTAGDDRPMSSNGEGTIDCHAERSAETVNAAAGSGKLSGLGETLAKQLQARAGLGARPHNRCLGEKSACDQFSDLFLHQIHPVGIRQITLGQRDNASLEVEQPQNFEMFARLRLDRVVGGNDQQRQVHTRRTGQHVSHKAFMSRHIDNSKSEFAQN